MVVATVIYVILVTIESEVIKVIMCHLVLQALLLGEVASAVGDILHSRGACPSEGAMPAASGPSRCTVEA